MKIQKNRNENSEESKSQSQQIGCNVSNCTHNDIDSSTCKLDAIRVSPCKLHGEKTPEDQTACASYYYSGDLNSEEKKGSLQA